MSIAFANELSMICDKLDMDVWGLIRLANRHPRVNILQPGPGVDGHCIAVDLWFVGSSAPKEARVIRIAREVNDAKPAWVLGQMRMVIERHLGANAGKSSHDVSVVIYGLAFKPDIDDLRESPALEIARRIVAEHPGSIWVVEPNVDHLPEELESASLVGLDIASKGDVDVMLVDHTAFKAAAAPVGRVIDVRGV